MRPLVEVRHLVKEFHQPAARFGRGGTVYAVNDLTFFIQAGEVFALVGESGSGKSTVGRCLLRLIEATSGEIRFDGVDLRALAGRPLRQMRRHLQMIFQDPYSSLNPRMRAGEIVKEPLGIHRIGTSRDRSLRVEELFGLVGLDPDYIERRPHQLSGGQRQRVGIARALALAPSFVVADEPVSSLDPPIQAQIVDLLVDLRQRLGLTYLFISHDLGLVRRIADRTAVMLRGRLVELAATDRVFTAPAHPYTQALLSAMPGRRDRDRPPRIRFDLADYVAPSLREIAPGHFAAI